MIHAAPSRLLLHVDVDAFFASVEQLLIPALRGRPVIVGNGVIASCSYEAREFGLHAGMPLFQARERCPHAEVLDGSYPTYRCFAQHLWTICRRYVTALETFLDEAYGDATGIAERFGGPEAMGKRLQREALEEVGLPVSVGLARNRMLAKVASGWAKPRGVAYIAPGRELEFLGPLPVRKLLGVGPKTARRLDDMNIETVAQLAELPRSLLRSLFGRYRGDLLYERARGHDRHEIRTAGLPHSISRETTFHRPLGDRGELLGMIFYLLQRAMRAVRKQSLLAGSVELTVRYEDWRQNVGARSLPDATDSEEEAFEFVKALFARLHTRRVALRHVGVTLQTFRHASTRAALFEHETRRRDRRLHEAVDSIRDRFGHAAVVSGRSIDLLGKLPQDENGFVLRTPSLTK